MDYLNASPPVLRDYLVITSKYAGTEVKMEGQEYNIVKQSDILAIVK